MKLSPGSAARLGAALAAILVLVLSAAPARAALDAGDKAAVDRIEAYLNTLHSVESEFVQRSSKGGLATGKLYLERPDHIRFDYDPPATLQIYASGTWLIFVDTALESVTHIPLHATVAGILVQKKVSLSGAVTVVKVARSGGETALHLVQTDEPDAGTLVLVLRDDPLRLTGWRVIDPQGVETEVALVAPRFNAAIDPKLFEFDARKYEPEPLE